MSRIQDTVKRMLNVLKEGRKSDAMLALLLIVIVDSLFRFGFALQEKTPTKLAFDAPYRSRAWWTTKDFLHQEKPPDVILLGASDINTAVYTAEATFFKKPQSMVLKHKSEYLERKMRDLDGPFKTNFCFCLGGEMPSDSYLLVNTLLTEDKLPKAILLAVTPRSFYDATFGDPTRTAIFKTMAKLGGTRDCESSCHSSLLGSADYLSRQAIALYGHKWEITSWQQRTGQSVLEKLLHKDFANVNTPQSIRKDTEQDLPEDFGPNEAMMLPYDEKHPIFIDSTARYQAYYKKIKHGMLPLQVDFYKKLCQFCSNHGVKLYVCNSPVTDENRNLIPPEIRAHYLAEIGGITRKYGGTFIDLDKPDLFKHSDFYDTVHLNGIGGQKYLDQLALILSDRSSLATAANSSAN